MLTGNFNLKNLNEKYSPSTLAGYGASEAWGAGPAGTGTWYSFSNYEDMKNFDTEKATISGEQNSVGLSITKWSKVYTASRTYSITTLVEPKK